MPYFSIFQFIINIKFCSTDIVSIVKMSKEYLIFLIEHKIILNVSQRSIDPSIFYIYSFKIDPELIICIFKKR